MIHPQKRCQAKKKVGNMTIEKILTGGPKMDNFSLTVILRKLFSIPPTSKIELIGLSQGN